jgi:hypothetical protein
LPAQARILRWKSKQQFDPTIFIGLLTAVLQNIYLCKLKDNNILKIQKAHLFLPP